MKTVFRNQLLLLPLLALGTLTVVGAHAADVAIVTGIGEYGNLPTATLPGIDHDVNTMTNCLSASGFRVIKLWNGQATEAGIRNAFAQAGRMVSPGDRFVYYQSSHGSEDNHLLTYDTTTSGEHTLGASDIHQLMSLIQTKRKSLIMDACFSGGIKAYKANDHVKFFPIHRFKDFTRDTVHDRCDTVVREYTSTPAAGNAAGGENDTFAIFASSQADETSLVSQVDGEECSVFTHYLATALNSMNTDKNHAGTAASAHKSAGGMQAAWNSVVQPTIQEVQEQTGGRQKPAFDCRYLTCVIYTTDPARSDCATSVSNLGQLYDVTNTQPDTLQVRAEMGSDADDFGRFRPHTQVTLHLQAGRGGYLFVINRDNEDNAQMIGWGREDLNFSNPERIVEQSYLSEGREFELGEGTLKITTTAREGEERWKVFLFTNREQALQFARLWCDQIQNKGKKALNRTTFKNAKFHAIDKLHDFERIDPEALFTSELNYRVTSL